jgi:hypothetical protein
MFESSIGYLKCSDMKEEKRLSDEEFLKNIRKFWKAGPKVKYQNPDRWFIHPLSRNLSSKTTRNNENSQFCWVVKSKK